MTAAVVVHCDWSLRPGARWMCVGRREGRGWTLAATAPVGAPATLAPRTARPGETVLIGADFPIGAPRAFAERAGLHDARAVLWRFTGAAGWRDHVADRPEDISMDRPFYPLGSGGKGERRRRHLEDALGLSFEALRRRCDRGTGRRPAACVMFWTLGGNQVGKGMLTGWSELVRPHLDRGAALWPFDGDLAALLGRGGTVLAESYPADALRQVGCDPPRGWSKRRRESRAGCADLLRAALAEAGAAPAAALAAEIAAGFPEPFGEDRFDAFVGALAMIRTVERGVETAPQDDAVRRVEGWMLGYEEPPPAGEAAASPALRGGSPPPTRSRPRP